MTAIKKLLQTMGELVDPFHKPDPRRYARFAGESDKPFENVGASLQQAMDTLAGEEPALRDDRRSTLPASSHA